MSDHPYRGLPSKAFWSSTVEKTPPAEVDPVGTFRLAIDRQSKIATAGSCFAQHIARRLRTSGFTYFVAEEVHPLIPAAVARENQYGVFSARFGNVYTARQLLQLFRRAFGSFTPEDDVWVEADGRVLDPFRPTVQPGGFVSEADMRGDRAYHLSAVRRMFRELDVLVFTLGLTECWRSRIDGAVYPLCPGVSGGAFDETRHEFYNQGVLDVHADLSRFVEALRTVNPAAQLVLTVSPVPLAATATPGGNVVSATSYSKSVLRVAADMLAEEHGFVHYFPSYEIITGIAARGGYFAADGRNITEAGVQHVMDLFMRHSQSSGAPQDRPAAPAATAPKKPAASSDYEKATAWVEALCDEKLLDAG